MVHQTAFSFKKTLPKKRQIVCKRKYKTHYYLSKKLKIKTTWKIIILIKLLQKKKNKQAKHMKEINYQFQRSYRNSKKVLCKFFAKSLLDPNTPIYLFKEVPLRFILF